MKNDKQSKRPRKPGRPTLEDYKLISKTLGMQIDGLTEGTSMFSKLASTKERIDYLIAKLERRAREPKKEKKKIQWKCLECGQIHEKRETIFQCQNCHSTSIEQFT